VADFELRPQQVFLLYKNPTSSIPPFGPVRLSTVFFSYNNSAGTVFFSQNSIFQPVSVKFQTSEPITFCVRAGQLY